MCVLVSLVFKEQKTIHYHDIYGVGYESRGTVVSWDPIIDEIVWISM